MKRLLVLAGAALLASAAVTAQPEQAEAGFLRRALVRGVHLGLMRHRHHHHFHMRRRIIIAPIIAAPVVAAPAMRTRARTSPSAGSAPRSADGTGRMFDAASMAWTDGKNQCWSGKQAWSFRNGLWFYGSHRWYLADGTWRTDAPEPPAAVECQSVPAFARVVPTTTTATQRPEEASRAEASDNTATECTKYSPSLGRVIRTACGS